MIEVYFDGACWPHNPGGTCSYGFEIIENGELCYSGSGYYPPDRDGETSNNLAEYAGLHAALAWLIKEKMTTDKVIVKGDSKLVIEQMKGRWKIKKGFYLKLAFGTLALTTRFSDIQFKWIPREKNASADALSKWCV